MPQILGKRKRSASEPSPLTSDNLALLEAAMPRPNERGTRTESDDSVTTVKSVSPGSRLAAHDIRINSALAGEKHWPEALADLVSTLKAPRYGPASPNAAHVLAAQPAAALKGEQGGIRDLEPWLFLRNYLSTMPSEYPQLEICGAANLHNSYLPGLSSNKKIAAVLRSPEEARPDSLIGFTKHEIALARQIPVEPALSMEQEITAASFRVCADVDCPCLSVQWKSPVRKGTHADARYQGARDGATIVSFNQYLLEVASEEPTITNTCHFSATCDAESVHFYVHWRNNGVIDMDFVLSCWLYIPDQVAQARCFVRNLLDYTIEQRLPRIRLALDKLEGEKVPLPPTAKKPPVPPFYPTPRSSSAPVSPQPSLKRPRPSGSSENDGVS